MAFAKRWGAWIALAAACGAPAGAALEEPRPDAEPRLEERDLQVGRPDLALAADPHSARSHRDRGRALAAQRRHPEAVAAFRQAARLDAGLGGLQRDLGESLFELGDFEAARDAFAAALRRDPGDSVARLELALAELELGSSDQAARRFDRVSQEAPDLAALALYNAAVAWARAGDGAAAVERLERMLALDAHPESSRRARELLEQVQVAGRPWRLDGSLGLAYDDELVSREIDLRAGRGDGAGVVDLGGAYRLVDDGSTQLEASYRFRQTAHFEASAFDSQSHSLGASLSRALGPVGLALDYRYSLATLGGDYLLGFHELRPAVQWRALPHLFAVAGPRLSFQDQEDSARDAIRTGAGVDAFLLPQALSERLPHGSFLRLGLAFESEQARGAEFDSRGFVLSGGLHWPFVLGETEHEVDVAYRFRWRDYANPTPSIGRSRLDRMHTARLRFARQLRGPAWLRLDYELGASDSNLPGLDYRSNAVMLGVAFSL